jgi:hypothetical protein
MVNPLEIEEVINHLDDDQLNAFALWCKHEAGFLVKHSARMVASCAVNVVEYAEATILESERRKIADAVQCARLLRIAEVAAGADSRMARELQLEKLRQVRQKVSQSRVIELEC